MSPEVFFEQFSRRTQTDLLLIMQINLHAMVSYESEDAKKRVCRIMRDVYGLDYFKYVQLSVLLNENKPTVLITRLARTLIGHNTVRVSKAVA